MSPTSPPAASRYSSPTTDRHGHTITAGRGNRTARSGRTRTSLTRHESTLCSMTDALIRRAEHADLAAIVHLRREWTREQDGDIADPDFDENLAAWFARESSRRIM